MCVGYPVAINILELVVTMVSQLLLEGYKVVVSLILRTWNEHIVGKTIALATYPSTLGEWKHHERHTVDREELLLRCESNIVPQAEDTTQSTVCTLLGCTHLVQEVTVHIVHRVAVVEVAHIRIYIRILVGLVLGDAILDSLVPNLTNGGR